MTLRAKFLLSLVLISTLITSAVLLVVRHRVEVRVHEDIVRALETSVVTFDRLQAQREVTLERSAALLAAVPTLKALMTSDHPATIQDASETFWRLAGSQVFVLADRRGAISAFHTSTPEFPRAAAQAAIERYVAGGDARDWWFGGGRLFQVFLQPISVGDADTGYPIGLLAVGYAVNDAVARDVSRVAASEVVFAYDHRLVVGTVPAAQRDALVHLVATAPDGAGPREARLGTEAFLTNTTALSRGSAPPVTLTVLKSLAEPTAFLESLNRWIVAIGGAGVLAGGVLVFLVSTSFTRPLGRLVSGVTALERGDYDYPLQERGSDEVSVLTAAFGRMRQQLQATQRQLIEAERLATIGRMANSISHDLRRPLTAILAYAEFLAERNLTDAQRHDYFQEIRIAVNHMIDEVNGLLGFSREGQALQPIEGSLDEVVDRAVKTVKALPEFAQLTISVSMGRDCVTWFDPGKVERVLLNLLFNAAEAVGDRDGRIDVRGERRRNRVELRVSDNGPGIPEAIASTLFEPFVSHGKQKGTGLGLTVVHNVMQLHGGDASVEHTGADGTTVLLWFPCRPAAVAS